MSVELVATLRHTKHIEPPFIREFTLANGKKIEAIGHISIHYAFEPRPYDKGPSELMYCLFYISPRLASSIIIGMTFLEHTKTLIEHIERLVRVTRPAIQALQVNAVGQPNLQLNCYLEDKIASAVPDSESEINLISPQAAIQYNLSVSKWIELIELIEFADGSCAESHLEADSPECHRPTKVVEFFSLEDPVYDILIGDNTPEELEIFTKHSYALTAAAQLPRLGAVNLITRLGRLEQVKERPLWLGIGSYDESPACLVYQRENDRREREEARIAWRLVHEQETALWKEVEKRRWYDENKTGKLKKCSSLELWNK
ncbi:hypothetical protein BS50DRAFT_659913 [Corynespora cassiicola Philippines]|uniref:Uncharacterized protein n=1 Tax=Corynespora cassiicola Philippines TaxID=1448308 RepID=A0A2T2P008_CORCC|nr:hypothetical protein BS50DRAFT_659913 [Corynespora cassiicola Philippines]